ncbi:LuxR family transcriptional regulator AbaR [Comamonas humi]
MQNSIAAVEKGDDAVIFLAEAARKLGFDYFAYGRRSALPFGNTKPAIISNYPLAWQERYVQAQYARIDPSISASRKSMQPLAWSDDLFASAPALWSEARDFGLKMGCAQFVSDGRGSHGMLTLARSHEVLSARELQARAAEIHWLTVLIHEHYPRIFGDTDVLPAAPSLTEREIEILRWSAEGKTAAEIAEILPISFNTVNFHLKNAMQKLSATNKAQAILRAALHGLLD